MPQDSRDPGSKTGKIVFFLAFVALAGAGGWMLAKVGENRAAIKAESESEAISGVGFVKPVEAPAKAPESNLPAPVPAPALSIDAPGVVFGDAIGPVTPSGVVLVAPETKPAGPAKLVVHTVPSGSVTIMPEGDPAAGVTGSADAAGGYATAALAPGDYAITVTHADYLTPEKPSPVTLKAGETAEVTLSPEPKPGSLIVLTDEGATVFLDGKKVGGGAVMLGKVASKKELSLKIDGPSGTGRTELVTLSPRENRLVDCRSAVVPAPVKPAESVPVAIPAPAPGHVIVRLISSSPDSGLIALVAADGSGAPLVAGTSANLRVPDVRGDVAVSCLRVFANVSVCKASGLVHVATPLTCELLK